jgi:hypothetical protein
MHKYYFLAGDFFIVRGLTGLRSSYQLLHTGCHTPRYSLDDLMEGSWIPKVLQDDEEKIVILILE